MSILRKCTFGVASVCIALASNVAFASDGSPAFTPAPSWNEIVNKKIPLSSWVADVQKANADFKAASSNSGTRKAATDLTSVYRPLASCRLVDTRGGAPLGGGPVAANSRRTFTPSGACGIPTSQVVGLSASVITLNLTPNNGGSFAVVAPGGVTSGVNGVYNTGTQWAGNTVNIRTNGSGAFDFFTALSTVEVVIDINGYYQDLDFLDIGTQELDIFGNGAGDVLGVNQAGSGRALALNAQTTGTAIFFSNGKFAVGGANNVGGSNFVYIHEVTAGSINGTCPARSNLNHPMLNGNPDAVIFVQPFNPDVGATPLAPVVAELVPAAGNVCTAQNNWRLFFPTGNAIVGHRYAIFIVNNN